VIGRAPTPRHVRVAPAIRRVRVAPTIRHVWVALTLTAAFIGPASSPIGLPDLFWTLLTGAWLVDHRALLEFDPFTSAPPAGGPVLNVQWLADVIFHALDAVGGLPLVITGTAVAVAATCALVLAATLTASGHLRLSCIAVWVAYVLGASNLSPRPQTLAYPLFGVFLLAIARAEYRQDNRLLWLLPPVMTLWVNLHGSFFVGFALLGCAAAGRCIATRRLRPAWPYLATLGVSVLASLVNPYGARALIYVASVSNNPIIRNFVTEWAPTTIGQQAGVLFFGSLVLVGGLAFKSSLRLSAFEVLVLLVFGSLAWSGVRGIVWWGLAVAPIVARLAGGALPTRLSAAARDRPMVNAVLLGGLFVMTALSLPWTKTAVPILPADKRGLLSDDTPVGVGEYLRDHDPPPTGKMFNNQSWGGYLEWVAWPRHKVFVDGRFELHPTQVWLDYLDVVFPSARWRTLLDEYDISYLVLSVAEQTDLIADLRADAAWRLDYEDDLAVVFSRTPSTDP
jgi:hypothetical protein